MKEELLHREILEEHARNPKNQRNLEVFDNLGKFVSQKTGNRCEVRFLQENGIIRDVGVTMQGSALALACSSIMSTEVNGHLLSQSLELAENMIHFLSVGKEVDLPGDLVVYGSIQRFPERHDCALLSWRALLNGID